MQVHYASVDKIPADGDRSGVVLRWIWSNHRVVLDFFAQVHKSTPAKESRSPFHRHRYFSKSPTYDHDNGEHGVDSWVDGDHNNGDEDCRDFHSNWSIMVILMTIYQEE